MARFLIVLAVLLGISTPIGASYIPTATQTIGSLSAAGVCSTADIIATSQDGGNTLVKTTLAAIGVCNSAVATVAPISGSGVGSTGSAVTGLTWGAIVPSGATAYTSITIAGTEQTPRIAYTTAGGAPTITPLTAGSSTVSTWAASSGGAALASSSSFTVTGPAITLANPGTLAIAAGSTTRTVPYTATMTGYGAVPSLDTSLNGAGYVASSGWTITTTTASGNILSVVGGSTTTTIKDHTGAPVSNTVTFNVENASFASQPSTTGTTGTALAGTGTVNALGLSTCYAGLMNGGSPDGSRVSFACSSGSAVPSLTPTASGAETINIFDAASSGNTLAVSNNITVAAGGYTGPGDVVTLSSFYGLRAATSAKATANVAMFNLCDHSFANCANVLSASNGYPGGSLVRGADNCEAINTCLIKDIYDQYGINPSMSWNASFTAALFVNASAGTHATAKIISGALRITTAVSVAQPFGLSVVLTGQNGGVPFNAPSQIGIISVSANTYNDYAGVSTSVTMADGVLNDMLFVANGGSSAAYVHGISAFSGNAGSNATGSTWDFLASAGNPIFCEFAIAPSAVSSGNALALHNNQSAAWGSY